MTYYAWFNCGEIDTKRATPFVEESDFPPHGFDNATRRGEGATEEEALQALARDVAAWDAIHDTETERTIANGMYVETADGGDGADAGWVLDVRSGEALIGWDSGARTWVSMADLVVVPRGMQSRHGSDHGLPTT